MVVIETGCVDDLPVVAPALRALKSARPESRVTVITRPGSAPALAGSPSVDRMLPLPDRERAGALGLFRLATWIRAQRFDAALVFDTSFRSALLAWLGGVPIRAGLACGRQGVLLTHRARRDPSACGVDERLRVLALLGIPSDGRGDTRSP